MFCRPIVMVENIRQSYDHGDVRISRWPHMTNEHIKYTFKSKGSYLLKNTCLLKYAALPYVAETGRQIQ